MIILDYRNIGLEIINIHRNNNRQNDNVTSMISNPIYSILIKVIFTWNKVKKRKKLIV